MKETIADVSSASPSSERMRGLWVNGVKKGIKEETDLRGNALHWRNRTKVGRSFPRTPFGCEKQQPGRLQTSSSAF